jgi:hypothetical protein
MISTALPTAEGERCEVSRIVIPRLPSDSHNRADLWHLGATIAAVNAPTAAAEIPITRTSEPPPSRSESDAGSVVSAGVPKTTARSARAVAEPSAGV